VTEQPATQDRLTDGTSYEQARDELAEVVGKLEAGGLTLDDSLTLWERGEHLARVCRQFLDGARERVDAALAAADDGAPGSG
jgi:exodeoxyribonuclease VII small subunit